MNAFSLLLKMAPTLLWWGNTSIVIYDVYNLVLSGFMLRSALHSLLAISVLGLWNMT